MSYIRHKACLICYFCTHFIAYKSIAYMDIPYYKMKLRRFSQRVQQKKASFFIIQKIIPCIALLNHRNEPQRHFHPPYCHAFVKNHEKQNFRGKNMIFTMKNQFSTLGYREPTKTKILAAFQSLLEGK